MNGKVACLVALLLAGFVLPAAQGAPPQRVTIAWELTRDGKPMAEIVDRLEHDGRRYTLAQTWTGHGILALRGNAKRESRGRIVAQGLRPDEFTDRRGDRLRGRARFDWSARRLSLERGDETHARPLPEGAADPLTMLWGFAFAPPPSGAVTLEVADGRGVKRIVFERAGRETLETPAGRFEALKLVKRREHPDDKPVEVWLAEKRGFLPVRILVTGKGGERIDQRARRIETR